MADVSYAPLYSAPLVVFILTFIFLVYAYIGLN